ncbi:hypothetical protein C8035_v001258 [Colletotrichum spinosum]|uniref:SMP domain-containing protein n=1 Tax=Colletotrichum spinosum TaxID=1347390 RepID=A0A4R8QG80_9PEZI|nr:hypothetical protein C8035_v001258 [Colletotrichum spinosum]
MSHKMTQSDASRIQSTQDKGGKDMSKDGFAARAQAAGDKNANAGLGAQGGGQGEKGGQGQQGQQGQKK